jgi:histidyl-tRNA synthetase
MLADAEIVAVIYEVLVRLGFTDFTVSINNRKILDGIGQYAGVPRSLQAGLYRSIDKLDKIGLDGVRTELLTVGLPDEPRQPLQRVARLAIQGKIEPNAIGDYLGGSPDEGGEGLDPALVKMVLGPMVDRVRQAIADDVSPGQLQAVTNQLVNDLAPQLRAYYGARADIIPEEAVDRLLGLLQITGPNLGVLDDLAGQMKDYPRALEGIDELRLLFGYLDALGMPESAYAISFAMVRGLEYYTGPIYETTIRKPKAMPSITGGGRYDELIGLFTDVSYPATGTSFGIERIIDAMDELGMFPPDIGATTAEVLVTVFDANTVGESLRLAAALRRGGVKTAMYFEYDDRLGDQIGYASGKGIPFVVILGPDEIAAGQATIRRLGRTRKESEQRTVPLPDIADVIRNW